MLSYLSSFHSSYLSRKDATGPPSTATELSSYNWANDDDDICGMPWMDFLDQYQSHGSKNKNNNDNNKKHRTFPTSSASSSSSSSFLAWTISGGPEYRLHLDLLLPQWEKLLTTTTTTTTSTTTKEPDENWMYTNNNNKNKLLVIALDQETATRACQLGYPAAWWNQSAAESYSKVADAKFQVSGQLAQRGMDQLFVELDVFCRKSPVPLFRQPHFTQQLPYSTVPVETYFQPDLVLIGHGDLQQKINIGMYYVRASERSARFFQTLTEILRHSLSHGGKYWRDQKGNQEDFFDQTVFEDCLLLMSEGRRQVQYFAWNDTNYTNDLLQNCRRPQPPREPEEGVQDGLISWAMIPNILISSYHPPTVYDSTYCIHPLAGQPFSSFRTKLATAKFFGFDPIDAIRDEKRPLLKTLSGDLVYSEHWDVGFFDHEFAKDDKVRYKNLQYPIALLVALAYKTNRVLVLPRHVRCQLNKAYPIFSLVSPASIEAWVPWRFLTLHEARALEDRNNATVVVELPTPTRRREQRRQRHPMDDDTLEDISNQCTQSSSQNQHQHYHHHQVCSIHGLFRTVGGHLDDWKPEEEEENSGTKQTLVETILQNLTWCLETPVHDGIASFPFVRGAGHFEYVCER